VAKRETERKRRHTHQSAEALPSDYQALIAAIAEAHDHAQRQVVRAVNVALTLRNWIVGYYIVEYEQHGSDCAPYGAHLLDNLTRDSDSSF
jgi:hypothetical protein